MAHDCDHVREREIPILTLLVTWCIWLSVAANSLPHYYHPWPRQACCKLNPGHPVHCSSCSTYWPKMETSCAVHYAVWHRYDCHSWNPGGMAWWCRWWCHFCYHIVRWSPPSWHRLYPHTTPMLVDGEGGHTAGVSKDPQRDCWCWLCKNNALWCMVARLWNKSPAVARVSRPYSWCKLTTCVHNCPSMMFRTCCCLHPKCKRSYLLIYITSGIYVAKLCKQVKRPIPPRNTCIANCSQTAAVSDMVTIDSL